MSGFVARSHGTVLTRYVEIGIAANTTPRRYAPEWTSSRWFLRINHANASSPTMSVATTGKNQVDRSFCVFTATCRSSTA